MESKLQRRVIADLTNRGMYVLKVTICNRPGWPDLTIFTKDGKVFFIELKDQGKKIEPLQAIRHQELEERGFRVFVIDTWEKYKLLE